MQKFLTTILFILIFFVGMGIGTYWHPGFFFNEWYPGYFLSKIAPTQNDVTDVSEQGKTYQFVNPLLFCKDQNISGFTDSVIQNMQDQVENYIKDETNKNEITDVGVYYKDLNNGPNFSVNASLQFAPASLLKVPTAMSIYKHAEGNPAFLSKSIAYTGGGISNATQYFPPAETIQTGTSYSIGDLVRYMLEDSDNAALSLLGNQLSTQELANSYSDLGLPVPDAPQPAYTTTVKTYASFFRVLFNASYLGANDSEHLLSLLTQSKFNAGIVAGIPAHVLTAHKFGEYTIATGKYQLHDCGIIYKTQEPYLLCVMTRGDNYDNLAKAIAHISNIVWNVLDEQ